MTTVRQGLGFQTPKASYLLYNVLKILYLKVGYGSWIFSCPPQHSVPFLLGYSEIFDFKRRLKGNRKLEEIDPEAFMGLTSLRRLDLSQTAVTSLPVRGLSELEILELIETRTLKEIPSVYNYQVTKPGL